MGMTYMTYGYEMHGLHQMYGVMYLELRVNKSQRVKLDENLYNGLKPKPLVCYKVSFVNLQQSSAEG